MQMCSSSKVGGAAVVHGEADLPDHHDQQVQEETGGAAGLLEDVSVDTRGPCNIRCSGVHCGAKGFVVLISVMLTLHCHIGFSQGFCWPDWHLCQRENVCVCVCV